MVSCPDDLSPGFSEYFTYIIFRGLGLGRFAFCRMASYSPSERKVCHPNVSHLPEKVNEAKPEINGDDEVVMYFSNRE